MDKFVAYKLVFHCEAETAVDLPRYNGTALRGAFFAALKHDFCLNKHLNTCLHCPASGACPICRLVATVERDSLRGAEIPRPFALQPVIDAKPLFSPGQAFSFGLTLFGDSLPLFPYAILAVQHMGETGMGNRSTAPGRFKLKEVRALNPFSGLDSPVYCDVSRMVNIPDVPITHPDVLAYCSGLNPGVLELRFLTPLRLVVEGSLVRNLTFPSFLRRLLRRLTDLTRTYSGQELDLDFAGLLRRGAEVEVIRDNTRWTDLSSYSRRRQASTPVGGLTGDISFKGNFTEFLPLLVWGRLTHVGKDATRGNGMYEMRVEG